MKDRKQEMSEIIKELRKLGAKPTDIASEIGVSLATLNRYVAERIDNPHRDRLKQLRRMLKKAQEREIW